MAENDNSEGDLRGISDCMWHEDDLAVDVSLRLQFDGFADTRERIRGCDRDVDLAGEDGVGDAYQVGAGGVGSAGGADSAGRVGPSSNR